MLTVLALGVLALVADRVITRVQASHWARQLRTATQHGHALTAEFAPLYAAFGFNTAAVQAAQFQQTTIVELGVRGEPEAPYERDEPEDDPT